MPRLKMLRGPEPGKIFSIQDDTITIGRGRRNQIIIHDNEVSREHCRLVRVLNVYEVHDLNSTNGTFVNGQRIDAGGWLLGGHHIIELGDSITLEFLSDTTSSLDESGVAVRGLAEPIKRGHYYLVIKRASQPEPEIYRLESNHIKLGRNLDNDIVLQEPEVSRHHITLSANPAADGYLIEDMETLNGTILNGNRLQYTSKLDNNDAIKIGTMVELWYTHDPEFIEQLLNELSYTTQESRIDDKAVTRQRQRQTDPRGTHSTGRLEINVNTALDPDALLGHVYIIYDHHDWDHVVAPLFIYLQDNGVPVWVDQHLTSDSDEWIAATDQALSECDCLLAIISDEALQDAHIQRAIRHFITRDKSLLLVKASDVAQVPMMIQDLPMIHINSNDARPGFRMILAEISKLNLSGS